MKRKTLISSLLLCAISIGAQETMSVDQAMQYAIENNTTVKVQEFNNSNARHDKQQAVASLFPSLSADIGATNSYGRSIDPETNTYTTSGNLSNSYGTHSSMTLFGGLTKINSIKASRLRVEMGGYALQQAKDQAALSVMQMYYNALYYQQSVSITAEQLQSAKEVHRLTEKQLELGIKSEADVALSASQVANFDLLLTQQQSLHSQSMLNLKEAMNFPLREELNICETSAPMHLSTTMEYNIDSNPEIMMARRKLDESKINFKISRGNLSPTIGLGAGLNTNYFRRLGIESEQMKFSQQIKENYGYYFGLSVSIPLFSNLSRRKQIAKSRNNVLIAQLQLQETELRVNKAVEQAFLERENSHKEQSGAQTKIEANLLAYRATQRKFEQGLVSIIELQETANILLQSKAEELRARLNYQIQCRMVDYYNGKQLINN